MPPGFEFPKGAQLWEPMPLRYEEMTVRRFHFLRVIGRLKPGVTIQRADQEMKAICAGLAKVYPDSNRYFSSQLVSLLEQMVGSLRPTLMLLMFAAGFVLSDRVRQRGPSATGARRGPAEGNRHSQQPGRQRGPRAAATAHGKRAARAAGRGSGRAAGRVRIESPGGASPGESAAPGRAAARRLDVRVHRRGLHPYGTAVRSRSRGARGPAGPGGHAEGRGPRRLGGTGPSPPAQRSGDGRSGVCRGAAGRGGIAGPQLSAAGGRESRVRPHRRAGDADRFADAAGGQRSQRCAFSSRPARADRGPARRGSGGPGLRVASERPGQRHGIHD